MVQRRRLIRQFDRRDPGRVVSVPITEEPGVPTYLQGAATTRRYNIADYPGYTRTQEGALTRLDAPAVKFVKTYIKETGKSLTASYIPKTVYFDSQGRVVREITRSDYKSYKGKREVERSIYVQQLNEYYSDGSVKRVQRYKIAAKGSDRKQAYRSQDISFAGGVSRAEYEHKSTRYTPKPTTTPTVPTIRPTGTDIAVTRGTEGGGTVTVTRNGLVTIRDAKGKILRDAAGNIIGRYYGNISQTSEFLKTESKIVRDAAEKVANVDNRTLAQKILMSIFTKQGKSPTIDAKGNVQFIEKGYRTVISPEGGIITIPVSATFSQTVFGLPQRVKVKQQISEIKKEIEKLKETAKLMPIKTVIDVLKKKEFQVKAHGDVLSKLEAIRDKYMQVIEGTQKSEAGKRMFYGVVVLGGIGLARGIVTVLDNISHPIKTAISLVKAARHPIETIETATFTFAADPIGTVAEFYAYSKTLNLVTKGIKRSAVGRYVHEETFIKANPKELRSSIRAIIKSSKVQEAINPFKIKSLKGVNFMEVKSLSLIEAKALEVALKKTDSVVFGSLASRTLTKPKSKLPLPKDVDLATSSINTFHREFVTALPKSVRKYYVIKGEKMINTRTHKPLFDIKPLNRLLPDKSILTRKGYLPVSGYVKKLRITEFIKKDVTKLISNINKRIKKLKKLELKASTTKQKRIISKEIKTQKKLLAITKTKGLRSKVVQKALKESITMGSRINPRIVSELGIAGLEFPTQKLVKVKGIKMVGFGEQTVRKGLGTLQVLLEKNIRRAKDPQAFVKSLQIQLEALKLKKPITPIGKLRLRSRIKTLENALRILTSREFIKLLESKVPGLTKEYPIVAKITIPKLKKVKLFSKEAIKRLAKKIILIVPKKRKPVKIIRKRKPIKIIPKKKRIPKRKPIRKRKPSKLPKPSRIPKKRISVSKLIRKRIPSKLPKRVPSKIPSKVPSKLPKRVPSRIPSKVPSKLPKRVPSKIPTRVPSKIPRRVPSKIPTRVPSKIPTRVPSKIPSKVPSRIPSRIPRKPPVPLKPKPPIRRTFEELARGKGVDVFVKKRGAKARYARINSRPLKYVDAKNLGRYITDNLPLASYRLIISKSKAKLMKFKTKTPAMKFRPRKGKTRLPSETKVEKRKYRIDRTLEKKGITIKGIKAARTQKGILELIRKARYKKRRKKIKRGKK